MSPPQPLAASPRLCVAASVLLLLAASPATAPSDPYALSPDDFAKLPAASQRFTATQVDIPLLEVAIFHAVNVQRAKHDLPALAYSRKLNKIAREHSQEMIALQYFDHVSPTPANKTLMDRVKRIHMPEAFVVAENIAYRPAMEMGSGSYHIRTAPDGQEIRTDVKTGQRLDYYTYLAFADAVVQQWMDSPHHRENILDKRMVFQGLGAARGPNGKQDSIYVTQNFATTVGPDDAKFAPPEP